MGPQDSQVAVYVALLRFMVDINIVFMGSIDQQT